jgi:hypothetical protein
MRKAYLVLIAVMVSLAAYSQSSDFELTDFKKADSIADLYYNYDLSDQKELTDLLIKDLNSEAEKFRVIFK